MPSRPSSTSDRQPQKQSPAPRLEEVVHARSGADASDDGSVNNTKMASAGELQQDRGNANSSDIASNEAVSSDEKPTEGQSVGLPIGCVDQIGHGGIGGWAWDARYPNESIDIEILEDDVVVLRLCADQHRGDLLKAGMGNGNHGFNLPDVAGVFPLSRHRVRLRRVFDGRDLEGSPAWITNHAMDPRTEEFMERVVFSTIRTAETANDLGQLLNHLLRLVNGTINAWHGFARSESDGPRSVLTDGIAGPQLTRHAWDIVSNLQRAYAPLHFEISGEPEVSVIIPVHNKFSYTYNCLNSIQQGLPKRTFEIIIVDDCSDDETLLCAMVFGGAVRIVRNAKNRGFVHTCNAGAAVAKGKYLLFLNNDTLVKDGWLDELVETFEQVPNVGIAGSKLLFENGTLQEAGGIIWRLGDGWNWGRDHDPAEPAYCLDRKSVV